MRAWYLGARNVQTCMRVGLCQRKNGLPSFLALSKKSVEAFTSTSSKVVMSYLAFGVMSCMFGTLDMGHPCRSPSCGPNCGGRLCRDRPDHPGRSTNRDPTSHRGDIGNRRTRRSHAPLANTCSDPRGGSCRTARLHSPTT